MRYRLYPWLLILCATLPASRARAYQTAGHFYSIVAELGAENPANSTFTAVQARVISFCVQVPDLAREFDAITTRATIPLWANMSWGLFDACWSKEVRHMVSVQHYLHALTGAPHDATLEAGRRTVAELRARLRSNPADVATACALGFATHMLGDSFAHERMDGSGRQYDTGLGHFRDDTKPDHPLVRADRLIMWRGYLHEARAHLKVALPPNALGLIANVAQRLFPVGGEVKNYDESRLATGLEDTLGSQKSVWVPYQPALEVANGKEILLTTPCSGVAQRYSAALGVSFDCNEAWRTYLQVARPRFARTPPMCDVTPDEESL
jgi:hypothetical protein